MGYSIAICGKGGVGKTTLSGLLISRLIARQCKPVLAIDADPNTCLDTTLGINAEKTVGSIRESVKTEASKGMASGISKQQLLEMKIEESIVEEDDFDLIAMGRPEGPGCYCYANNVLKEVIKKISSQYPYLVLDNEAGLENLSRRIIQKVDLLIMVTDPSQRGLETVKRLHQLANEMEIQYEQSAVFINRLRKAELPQKAQQLKQDINAQMIVGLPDDIQLAELAEEGATIFNLPTDNPIIQKLDQFLDSVLEAP